jgi:hypothetical protein
MVAVGHQSFSGIRYINQLVVFLASSCFLFSLSGICFADSYGPIDLITPVQKSELWLNPGIVSYHFDQGKNFNAANYGFGAEYRFSSVASVTVGTFRNSNYYQSDYIGVYWQPIAIGPVNLGLVAGGLNGYSLVNNGGWFPAVLPAFTVEGKWVGLNLIVIPTIGDRVSGALSFQMKFKIFD